MMAIAFGGYPGLFWDTKSILIVVGGTVATTLIRFPLDRLKGTLDVVRQAFFNRLPKPDKLIKELIEMSRKARQEGLLALENYKTHDKFLKQGLQLIVDGLQREAVEEILNTDIKYLQRRHRDGQDILKSAAEAAPAFGMIGTLIGLVVMLAHMDDVKTLGPAMAVAILTTLYGALIANLIVLPLAKKLEVRSRQETLNRELILVGLLSIQRGENPRTMETVLKAFLRKRQTEGDKRRPKEVKAA